jgi:PKD repeat protein
LLTVEFSDLSAGNFTQWSWNFGDNQTSTEQNPSHTYLSAGVYTVTLTISGTSGENTESKINFIMVGAKGDVNGDGNVDLTDEILCLQVLSGLAPDNINPAADVNGDGKIGMAEAIYIMQKVAGLR